MNLDVLPTNIQSLVSQEQIDFIAHSSKSAPFGYFRNIILFSSIFIFMGIFFMILQYFAPKHNLATMGVGGIFFIGGVFLMRTPIIRVFKNGGYFIGTKQHLIHSQKNKTNYIPWQNFTGIVEREEQGDIGNILLEKHDILFRLNNKPVHDIIYISGVKNFSTIYEFCVKRIQEAYLKDST